ncbi:DUF5808 domain-containing protein [Isoptericola sp. NEAU-Y5]|uniref:DUF5808 domain-containing protein n=1 Tax=Isoptericola luteus TaxID=2879484 RepID=A0ABS7ZGN3_9MICO|nr:DUF5808 domain-containing protein [Isoptericola sp. NEAU-Y5]MCA5894182.1 DUF5808 domain-containing protein [Isoptericola sp. NEAU-Y5]
MGQRTKKKSGLKSVVRLVTIGLVVAAVAKELQKDEDDRTWNGTVAGFVPYDFRVPTVDRIRERMWDPEGEHIVSPHVFGVGWTLNLGRVVTLARAQLGQAAES